MEEGVIGSPEIDRFRIKEGRALSLPESDRPKWGSVKSYPRIFGGRIRIAAHFKADCQLPTGFRFNRQGTGGPNVPGWKKFDPDGLGNSAIEVDILFGIVKRVMGAERIAHADGQFMAAGGKGWNKEIKRGMRTFMGAEEATVEKDFRGTRDGAKDEAGGDGRGARQFKSPSIPAEAAVTEKGESSFPDTGNGQFFGKRFEWGRGGMEWLLFRQEVPETFERKNGTGGMDGDSAVHEEG